MAGPYSPCPQARAADNGGLPTPRRVPGPLLYRTLVWLDYRLAALVAVGLPLVLLVWSAMKQERAMQRLLSIYWKVASLLLVAVLLLTDNQGIRPNC